MFKPSLACFLQDHAGMSAHERRMARMRERVAKLEASALAQRDWFLRGEAQAGVSCESCFAATWTTPSNLHVTLLTISVITSLPCMNCEHALLKMIGQYLHPWVIFDAAVKVIAQASLLRT